MDEEQAAHTLWVSTRLTLDLNGRLLCLLFGLHLVSVVVSNYDKKEAAASSRVRRRPLDGVRY
jgi:hypothetical protein